MDTSRVAVEDTENDFLCCSADIGLKKGEVVKSKLAEMNPFVELEFKDTEMTFEAIGDIARGEGRIISAVIHGFDTWANAQRLNAEARSISAAFYSVSSSGLYGFAYADLGPNFSYQCTIKDQGQQASEAGPSMETHTVSDSLTLDATLTQFEDTNAKLTWNRRRKQPCKMLLAAFLTMFMKEKNDDGK